MKILILSCNTGEGHNAAGHAVEEAALARGHEVNFVDAMQLGKRHTSRLISGLYIGIVKHLPWFFGFIYKLGMLISNRHFKSPVYWANAKLAKPLASLIEEGNYDIVVMPHLYPAETITYMKKHNMLPVKAVAIGTDYTCIPFWEETECDYYILPHKDLVEEFRKKQMPKEKLYPLGIPVSKPFRTRGSRQEAREILGLPSRLPVFLIMTGSMGYGRIEDTIQELVNLYGSRAVIVVICGNNAKLKESLENQCKGHPNVIIQGFTKKIPLYMDACDVLFSKPGGLTSTEAAVKGVPLIHTAPIPGCENRNAAFFARRGMSYYCQEPAQQAKYAKLLCENQFLRFRMAEAQRRNTNAGSAEEICGLLRQAVGSDEVTSCMF